MVVYFVDMRHPDQCCNKVVVGTLTPLLSIILSFKRLRCYEASRSVNNTMPSTAATAYHSSPCFSLQSPSSLPSNSHQPNNPLTIKPKNVLQKHPLYTPAHSNLSLQFKEKILCLEIMGVDSGKALSLNPSLHTATLHSIHSIISFLQSKGIHQKDLGRIFGIVENNFKPKFEYFVGEMEGNLEELKEFPQYFAFSLEKRIKPRHMEAVQNGVKVPLALMLKSTDEEFRELMTRHGRALQLLSYLGGHHNQGNGCFLKFYP
ncbi:unnamed protein product, partial [Vitis vinifera]